MAVALEHYCLEFGGTAPLHGQMMGRGCARLSSASCNAECQTPTGDRHLARGTEARATARCFLAESEFLAAETLRRWAIEDVSGTWIGRSGTGS